MASKSKHIIQRQFFELDVDNRELAKKTQQVISRLANHRLPAIIDRILERYDVPHQIIRIDKLHLNLGAINFEKLDEQLPQLFEQALEEHVHTEIQYMQQGHKDAQTRLINEESAQLELLEHFLTTGQLPWWAKSMSLGVEEVFQRLMLKSPQRIRSFIYEIAVDSAVRKRIIHQFSDQTIEQLFRVMTPQQANFFREYVEDLTTLQEKQQVVNEETRNFKKVLQELTLKYLIDHKATSINQQAFFEENVSQLAQKYGLSVQQVLTQFQLAIAKHHQHIQRQGAIVKMVDVFQKKIISTKKEEVIDAEKAFLFYLTKGFLPDWGKDLFLHTTFEELLKSALEDSITRIQLQTILQDKQASTRLQEQLRSEDYEILNKQQENFKQASQEELLLYFLVYGHFPEWAKEQVPEETSWAQLLQTLAQSPIYALQFTKLLDQPQVVQRIQQQFGETTLAHVQQQIKANESSLTEWQTWFLHYFEFGEFPDSATGQIPTKDSWANLLLTAMETPAFAQQMRQLLKQATVVTRIQEQFGASVLDTLQQHRETTTANSQHQALLRFLETGELPKKKKLKKLIQEETSWLEALESPDFVKALHQLIQQASSLDRLREIHSKALLPVIQEKQFQLSLLSREELLIFYLEKGYFPQWLLLHPTPIDLDQWMMEALKSSSFVATLRQLWAQSNLADRVERLFGQQTQAEMWEKVIFATVPLKVKQTFAVLGKAFSFYWEQLPQAQLQPWIAFAIHLRHADFIENKQSLINRLQDLLLREKGKLGIQEAIRFFLEQWQLTSPNSFIENTEQWLLSLSHTESSILQHVSKEEIIRLREQIQKQKEKNYTPQQLITTFIQQGFLPVSTLIQEGFELNLFFQETIATSPKRYALQLVKILLEEQTVWTRFQHQFSDLSFLTLIAKVIDIDTEKLSKAVDTLFTIGNLSRTETLESFLKRSLLYRIHQQSGQLSMLMFVAQIIAFLHQNHHQEELPKMIEKISKQLSLSHDELLLHLEQVELSIQHVSVESAQEAFQATDLLDEVSDAFKQFFLVLIEGATHLPQGKGLKGFLNETFEALLESTALKNRLLLFELLVEEEQAWHLFSTHIPPKSFFKLIASPYTHLAHHAIEQFILGNAQGQSAIYQLFARDKAYWYALLKRHGFDISKYHFFTELFIQLSYAQQLPKDEQVLLKALSQAKFNSQDSYRIISHVLEQQTAFEASFFETMLHRQQHNTPIPTALWEHIAEVWQQHPLFDFIFKALPTFLSSFQFSRPFLVVEIEIKQLFIRHFLGKSSPSQSRPLQWKSFLIDVAQVIQQPWSQVWEHLLTWSESQHKVKNIIKSWRFSQSHSLSFLQVGYHQFDLINYFFTVESLPPWSSIQTLSSFEHQLKDVLQHQSKEFGDYWLKFGTSWQVSSAVWQTFHSSTQEALYTWLRQQNIHQEKIAIIDQFKSWLNLDASLIAQIDTIALPYLLSSSSISAIAFIEELLSTLAWEFQLPAQELQEQLLQATTHLALSPYWYYWTSRWETSTKKQSKDSEVKEEETFTSGVDELFYFLQKGEFAWWFNQLEEDNFEELFFSLLKQLSTAELKQLRQSYSSVMGIRIYGKLSVHGIEEFLSILFPNLAGMLITQALLFEAFFKQHRSMIRTSDQQRFVWQAILDTAFSFQSEDFSLEEFMQKSILQLNRFVDASMPFILEQLMQLSEEKAANGQPRFYPIIDLLPQRLETPKRSSKKQAVRISNAETQQPIKSVKGLVSHYIKTGQLPAYQSLSKQEFHYLLLRFIKGASNQEKALIQRSLKKETFRKSLFKNFDRIVVWELIKLMMPSQQATIRLIWEALDRFLPQIWQASQVKIKGFYQHLFFELFSSGKRFDVHHYLHTLFTQLAQSRPLSRQDFQRLILDKLSKNPSLNPVFQEEVKQWAEVGMPVDSSEEEEVHDEAIYIENAGLVLIHPFLTRFFRNLNMLEGKAFKDEETAHRAVHLLQYMVNGQTESPEHELTLNKLLCGVPLLVPVPKSIDMTEAEEQMCQSLLKGVMANWSKMRGTTIQGFRETFLQREGRLADSEEFWQLHVERKSYDMLLASLPWKISTINLNWMSKPLLVEWEA